MWVGGQRHAPAVLPPGKTRYPLYRRLGGPQGRSGQVRKISPPTGIRSPDRPARRAIIIIIIIIIINSLRKRLWTCCKVDHARNEFPPEDGGTQYFRNCSVLNQRLRRKRAKTVCKFVKAILFACHDFMGSFTMPSI